MPKPKAGEDRGDFISRCVPIVIGEGAERDHAVAKCNGIWRSRKETGGKQMSEFYIRKQANGVYRWFSIFSNAYRDRDFPPEILTEAAQINFAKAVNDGSWPYPELWLYHIPGSRCGVADLVAYDTHSKLSIASGVFDKGKELIAEALTSTSAELKTSHGFPRSEVQRDTDDPTIIIRFRSKEISPLPADAAANELTGFKILGGKDMNLVPNEKERLSELFSDEEVEQIADVLSLMGDEAKEANLEFKKKEDEETDTEAEAKVEVEAEVKAKETEVKAEVEPVVEPTAEPTVDPVDRKEVEDAVKAIASAISELTSQVSSSQAELQDELKAIADRLTALERPDEEKIAEQTAGTPRASLAQIVQASVIGKEQVRVDGRKARHEGPEETKPEEETIVNTGHMRMDRALTAIVTQGMAGFQGGQ